MAKRIINLGSGDYHENIQGNYIQRDRAKKDKKTINVKAEVIPESIVINTNGANFTESLEGDYIINAEILD